MKQNPLKPYNDLPDLPPKSDIETKEILKKAISASRTLSELKGAITNLPNPLLFIDTVYLHEAQAVFRMVSGRTDVSTNDLLNI